MIAKALVLQLIIAFLLVKFPLGKAALSAASDFVTNVLSYGSKGIEFLFGLLDFLRSNKDVRGLTACPTEGLMDHHS